MKLVRNTNFLGTILISITLCILTSCTKFKRDDPSPVGMFYPNQPIQGVYFTKDSWDNKENKISFSQPAEIKAVGMMTWNSLMGNYYETALLSPKLDHLPGDYWMSTDGDYYATISWLQANGRIEYTGSKTSGDYFWESFARFLTSTFGIIIEIILLIIGIVILRSRASTSTSVKSSSSSSSGGSYSSNSDSSYSSYSSEYDSNETYASSEESREIAGNSNSGGTTRCTDCQSIDLSGWGFTSKGNGRCKDCDGTGHDKLTEAIVQFGTFGTETGKYDCKTCYGTGQCQTCGGTGIVYY